MSYLSGLQSTNERQANKSTNHEQEHRTFPAKYQTADVLTNLFEECDGKSQVSNQPMRDKPKFIQSCAAAENSTAKKADVLFF